MIMDKLGEKLHLRIFQMLLKERLGLLQVGPVLLLGRKGRLGLDLEEVQKVCQIKKSSISYIYYLGSKARVMMTSDYGSTWTAVETSMEAGGDTAGIFSLAVQGEKLVAVGGDFSLPGESSRRTVSISKDGGLTWAEPNSPTFGYRSVSMKVIRYIDIMLFQVLCCFYW